MEMAPPSIPDGYQPTAGMPGARRAVPVPFDCGRPVASGAPLPSSVLTLRLRAAEPGLPRSVFP